MLCVIITACPDLDAANGEPANSTDTTGQLSREEQQYLVKIVSIINDTGLPQEIKNRLEKTVRQAINQGIPGREVAARGVAFVIARSIARKGIAPRHYFAKAWTRSEANMTAAILLAIAKTGSWKPTAKGRIAIQTMFKVGPKGPGAP